MGFGYFLAGLWWVGSAFLVEADRFAWALPLGVVRVLVADLIEIGAITVVAQRSTDKQTGNVLQEILNGLRAL